MIPLILKTNETTGEIEQLDGQGNPIEQTDDDVLSFNGSEVVVNTRNSVQYRKFFDDQVTKFKREYDAAASAHES
jgi:hypothetical protein